MRCASPLSKLEINQALWRICVPTASTVLPTIRALQGKFLVDWAGGLVWAQMPTTVSGTAIRELAERAGGHATLMNAPIAYRLQTSALHPESPNVAALAQRVRAAFDPAAILDPQRFVERAR
jgi:glycolate oxidase FAD binding subunit